MVMARLVIAALMMLSVDAKLGSQVPAPVKAFEEEIEQLGEGMSTSDDDPSDNSTMVAAQKIANGIVIVPDKLIVNASVIMANANAEMNAQNFTAVDGKENNSTDQAPGALAKSDGLEMTAGQMEATITSLMLGKSAFGATPMGSSVKKITDILIKTMMPKVLAAHRTDQRALNRLAKEIAKCGRDKESGLRVANVAFKKYRAGSKLHKQCRSDEAIKYTSKMNCASQEKSKQQIKALKCNAFAAVSRKWGSSKNNAVIVRKGAGESVESYITRLSRTFCGKLVHGPTGKLSRPGGYGGGLEDGALDEYLKAKGACSAATKDWKAKVKECRRKTHSYNVRRAQCNQYQDQMDGSSCKRAGIVKDTCESYAGCYFAKVKAYRALEKRARMDEMDRKAEWRGLKRMACLMKSFADGKVTNKEIEVCKKKTHSTKHLNLKYPGVPPLAKCAIPRSYPSTGEYVRSEFAVLPALAKGKASAECTGVKEVSLKPWSGSPKSCKCRRVVTNGFYTAGALVKCTNCRDVRRSGDRSSCPSGTKLFSPASRNDWKTFLSSAGPLRAPHWILDVTRPQNGCGGCTRNPMNSGNSRQKTWKTADGSPWWLRNSRYNEPNGDYNANCYLDLWQKPKNENSVTFNDGRCNYHSKSYYCQLTKMNLQPRKGSPVACKCTKVQLAGAYSAGDLLKCEQCTTVYRSTQKNSCPSGMKLFSPRSRADWRTFLKSAGPLRAPHWIIDVTRPQNGCGGCTRYPMKQSSPQQATWRTSDGSSWWLRNSRYNEPNGDYNANCYLDLWRTPNSENNIQFNDGRCNYRSRSYYCQSIQKAKPRRVKRAPPPPRLLVPWNKLRTGLLMKAYYFRQGSRCPNLGYRSPNSGPSMVKSVNTVNYPTTGKAWPSFTTKDNFAVRWDGLLYIRKYSSGYRFHIGSDDGSKLYLDGKLKINNDGLHGMRYKSCWVSRFKGPQTRVYLTMFEKGGHAGMVFKYRGADTNNRQVVVPARALRYQRDKGWKEEIYYNVKVKSVPNFNKLKPATTRTVSQIRYTNTGTYWPYFSQKDNFAVRWTGRITISRSGTYRFQTSSDDGSMLYVQNKRIVDNNGLHGWRSRWGNVRMRSGQSTLRCEFFERGGHAGMALYYMGSDTRNRLVTVPSKVMEADV